MKKTLIIIWIILALILINLFSINAFYNHLKAKQLYENKDFSWALNIFEKKLDYIWLYNSWNSYYKLWENSKKDKEKLKYWETSLQEYLFSMKRKYTKKAEENYNFVKKKLEELKKKIKEKSSPHPSPKGEGDKSQKNNQNKQNSKDNKNSKNDKNQDSKNQNKSWNWNNNSPIIPFHKGNEDKKNGKNSSKKSDTQQNASAFWKEKQKSKENSWEKKNQKNSQQSNKDNKWKSWDKQEQAKQEKNSNSWEQQKKSANQQRTKAPWKENQNNLTPYQEAVLKAYEQRLKEEQKQNAWNFWKVYKEQNNDIFDNFDSFFENDPFFDNSLLNSGNDKKDW